MPEQQLEYEYDHDDDEYADPDELGCLICGGEGYIDGEDMAEMDPLWYDADEVYRCCSCNGTGKRKDMTVW
jgi:hypothetical protein